MPITIERTDLDTVANRTGEYAVKAFNNETTSFEAVLMTFIVSCGYSEQIATEYTLAIHKNGSSVCYKGSKDACEGVISDFAKIGVTAKLIEPNAK